MFELIDEVLLATPVVRQKDHVRRRRLVGGALTAAWNVNDGRSICLVVNPVILTAENRRPHEASVAVLSELRRSNRGAVLAANEAWTSTNQPKAVNGMPARAEDTRTLTTVSGRRASTDDDTVSIGAPSRGVVVAIPTGRSDGLTRRQVTVRAQLRGGCGAGEGRLREPPRPSRAQNDAPHGQPRRRPVHCLESWPQPRHRRRRIRPDHARRAPCSGPAANPDPPRARRNLTSPPSDAPPGIDNPCRQSAAGGPLGKSRWQAFRWLERTKRRPRHRA